MISNKEENNKNLKGSETSEGKKSEATNDKNPASQKPTSEMKNETSGNAIINDKKITTKQEEKIVVTNNNEQLQKKKSNNIESVSSDRQTKRKSMYEDLADKIRELAINMNPDHGQEDSDDEGDDEKVKKNESEKEKSERIKKENEERIKKEEEKIKRENEEKSKQEEERKKHPDSIINTKEKTKEKLLQFFLSKSVKNNNVEKKNETVVKPEIYINSKAPSPPLNFKTNNIKNVVEKNNGNINNNNTNFVKTAEPNIQPIDDISSDDKKTIKDFVDTIMNKLVQSQELNSQDESKNIRQLDVPKITITLPNQPSQLNQGEQNMKQGMSEQAQVIINQADNQTNQNFNNNIVTNTQNTNPQPQNVGQLQTVVQPTMPNTRTIPTPPPIGLKKVIVNEKKDDQLQNNIKKDSSVSNVQQQPTSDLTSGDRGNLLDAIKNGAFKLKKVNVEKKDDQPIQSNIKNDNNILNTSQLLNQKVNNQSENVKPQILNLMGDLKDALQKKMPRNSIVKKNVVQKVESIKVAETINSNNVVTEKNESNNQVELKKEIINNQISSQSVQQNPSTPPVNTNLINNVVTQQQPQQMQPQLGSNNNLSTSSVANNNINLANNNANINNVNVTSNNANVNNVTHTISPINDNTQQSQSPQIIPQSPKIEEKQNTNQPPQSPTIQQSVPKINLEEVNKNKDEDANKSKVSDTERSLPRKDSTRSLHSSDSDGSDNEDNKKTKRDKNSQSPRNLKPDNKKDNLSKKSLEQDAAEQMLKNVNGFKKIDELKKFFIGQLDKTELKNSFFVKQLYINKLKFNSTSKQFDCLLQASLEAVQNNIELLKNVPNEITSVQLLDKGENAIKQLGAMMTPIYNTHQIIVRLISSVRDNINLINKLKKSTSWLTGNVEENRIINIKIDQEVGKINIKLSAIDEQLKKIADLYSLILTNHKEAIIAVGENLNLGGIDCCNTIQTFITKINQFFEEYKKCLTAINGAFDEIVNNINVLNTDQSSCLKGEKTILGAFNTITNIKNDNRIGIKSYVEVVETANKFAESINKNEKVVDQLKAMLSSIDAVSQGIKRHADFVNKKIVPLTDIHKLKKNNSLASADNILGINTDKNNKINNKIDEEVGKIKSKLVEVNNSLVQIALLQKTVQTAINNKDTNFDINKLFEEYKKHLSNIKNAFDKMIIGINSLNSDPSSCLQGENDILRGFNKITKIKTGKIKGLDSYAKIVSIEEANNQIETNKNNDKLVKELNKQNTLTVLSAVTEEVIKKDPSKFKQFIIVQRQHVLDLVKVNGLVLEFLDQKEPITKWKEDKEIVLEAVKQNRLALKYVDLSKFEKHVKRTIVMAAIVKTTVVKGVETEIVSLEAMQFIAENSLNKTLLNDDQELFLMLIEKLPEALKYYPTLANNSEFVIQAVTKNAQAFKFINPKLQQDKELCKKLVVANAAVFEYMDEEKHKDLDVVRTMLEQDKNNIKYLCYATPDFKNNNVDEIAELTVNSEGGLLEKADDVLKKNPAFVKKAIKKDPKAFKFADKIIFSNRHVAYAAVKADFKNLELVDEGLKTNSDNLDAHYVVEAAINTNSMALWSAREKFQVNPEFTSMTFKKHEQECGGKIKINLGENEAHVRKLIINGLRNGCICEGDEKLVIHYSRIPAELFDDKEIAKEAVMKNGLAIKYFTSFYNTQDVLVQALQNNGEALRIIKDKKVIDDQHEQLLNIAIKQNTKVFKRTEGLVQPWFSKVLKDCESALKVNDDKKLKECCVQLFTVICLAVGKDKDLLKDAQEYLALFKVALKDNWKYLQSLLTSSYQQAVNENGLLLEFVDDEFNKDRNFVLAAVKNNGLAYKFITDDKLKNDVEIVSMATNYRANKEIEKLVPKGFEWTQVKKPEEPKESFLHVLGAFKNDVKRTLGKTADSLLTTVADALDIKHPNNNKNEEQKKSQNNDEANSAVYRAYNKI